MSSTKTGASVVSDADRLKDIIFALGPDGRYFYNSETAWARNRLPKTIETILTTHHVTRIICCAFGPTPNNWIFVSRERAVGETEKVMVRWGSHCPPSLISWLLDPETKKPRRNPSRLHVVLGPHDSFAAWDTKSYRSSLPGSLQTWLTAHGCQHDPPRALALGHGGEYFVVAKNGAYSFRSTCLKSLDVGGRSWRSVRYITFSAALPKRCVVVFDDTYTACSIPVRIGSEAGQKAIDDLRRVSDSYAEESVKMEYIRQRHDQDAHRVAGGFSAKSKKAAAEKKENNVAQEENEQHAAGSTAKKAEARPAKSGQQHEAPAAASSARARTRQTQAQKAKQAAAEEARKASAAAAAEERAAQERAKQAQARQAKARHDALQTERRLPSLYKSWITTRNQALTSSTSLLRGTQDFPQASAEVCTCKLPGCVQRKNDTGLNACKHDMKRLLKASGKYSVAWLRKERLCWHPDRFARKCEDGNGKEALVRKATEMWEIYGELIEEG